MSAIADTGQQNLVGKASAFVIVSCVVVFLPEVSPRNQEDVRNSVEFCARAADSQYPPPTDPEKWYNRFRDAMLQLHWFVQMDGERTDVKGSVLDSFSMSSQERALVEKTLNALQNKAENAVAAKLLSEEVLGSTEQLDVNHLLFVGGGQLHGRFQLVVCSEKNKAVAISAPFFNFNVSGSVYNVLLPNQETQTKTTIEMHQYALNGHQYNDVRDKIRDKLVHSGKSLQAQIVLDS